MSDSPLFWALLAPLTGGAVAALLLALNEIRLVPPAYAFWLRVAALASVCAALLGEGILVAFTPASATLNFLGVSLTISTPARLGLIGANVALFCAIILAWGVPNGPNGAYSPRPGWTLLLSLVTSSLLAGAALVTDRLAAALCLLGAAVAASALCLARPRLLLPMLQDVSEDAISARSTLARRMAGGLKHLSLASIGTGLLVMGALLVSRYAFNLENRELLQLGLGLLAMGLLVRSGAMPFSAAAADTLEAAPNASILMLGAGTPITLIAVLLMLAPIEGSLARDTAGGWLGAVAALLAGLRALAAARHPLNANANPHNPRATQAVLTAMTVATTTGWAIFGILSGSQAGAVGAVLIALNMSLALPLVVASSYMFKGNLNVPMLVGAASLLGLPPFGGFAGTLLVAQGASDKGGLWLALLLIGSALVVAAWLIFITPTPQSQPPNAPSTGARRWLANPSYLLALILIIVQLALFIASTPLVELLTQWATVPWLS